jgi:hypothetical protein
MSDTIKDALALLAIFALGLLLWIATPGDAQAAVLTPEGAAVFSELWDWYRTFAAICMTGGILGVAYVLIHGWFRPKPQGGAMGDDYDWEGRP